MTRSKSGVRAAVALLIIVGMFALPVFAERYQIRSFSDEPGLPSTLIYDAAQDPTGRVWLVTRGGLVAYDGLQWRAQGAGPIRHLRVIAIAEDGTVWVAGGYPSPIGVGAIRGGEVRVLPRIDVPERRDSPLKLTLLPGPEPRPVVMTDGGHVFAWDGGDWRQIDLGTVDGYLAAHDVAWFEGALWVATRDGLFVVDPETFSATALERGVRPTNAVLALAADRDGRTLWMAGRGWLARRRGGVLEVIDRDAPFRFARPHDELVAEVAADGAVYVGNPLGLFRFDGTGSSLEIGRRQGLTVDGANVLLGDREGNTWVGTQRGLSRIESLRFCNQDSRDGLFTDEVTAVVERRPGEMVLGHPGGFTLFGESVRTYPLEGTGDAARVLDLERDSAGDVWIAAKFDGLLRLTVDGDLIRYGEPDGLLGLVSSVRESATGELWVATDEGFFIRRGERFDAGPSNGEPGERIGYARRLFASADGRMLAAYTRQGMVPVTRAGLGAEIAGETEDSHNVYAYLETGDGAPWVGAMDGLHRFESGRLVKSTTPRIDRPIYFLTRDHDDRLWVGTTDGVYRWDGERLEHYSVHNGLAGRETNRAAGFVDRRGHVWIGTSEGLSIYRPELDQAMPFLPTVEVMSIEAAGEAVDRSSPVRLDHDRGTVVYRYRAITMADPSRVRYRARLVGFDEDWLGSFPGTRRELRYTNLPPGNYRFEVQASLDGEWGPVTAATSLAVASPLWREPGVLVVAMLSLALAVWLVVSYFAQRRLATRLELEVGRRVGELRDIERELARAQRLESLGVLAGGIAHDFNNMLTAIVGRLSLLEGHPELPARMRPVVREAIDSSLRARGLTEQLLTFSRGGAPRRESSVPEDLVRGSVSLVMTGKNVGCEVRLPDGLWPVNVDGSQIQQVLNNLLLNAVQAMPDGGTIEILGQNVVGAAEIGFPTGRFVRLTVVDHGPGIPADVAENVFEPYFTTKDEGSGLGLATSYSILRRHAGALTFETGPGGTRFHVWLPAADRAASASAPLRRVAAEPADILVMDDEPSVRQVVREMLELLGHSVEVAESGEQAIDLYERRMGAGRRFDLVILDLTVPGAMGGLEAMRRLRRMDPDVCAVVSSGYSSDQAMSDFGSHGFRGVIPKPFSRDELIAGILSALEQSVSATRDARRPTPPA